MSTPKPRLIPLGDRALLVRFGDTLDEAANRAAIAFAARLEAIMPAGAVEVTANLVSVLITFDPARTDATRLAADLRILPPKTWDDVAPDCLAHTVQVRFDGEDLPELCQTLGLDTLALVAAHNASPLRVLATGFAPGFVYCGFHAPFLRVPRRTTIRPVVRAGTVLFAAGQTAIAATAVPTGWHVIGHTGFRNFDAAADPPTVLRAGDTVQFEAAP